MRRLLVALSTLAVAFAIAPAAARAGCVAVNQGPEPGASATLHDCDSTTVLHQGNADRFMAYTFYAILAPGYTPWFSGSSYDHGCNVLMRVPASQGCSRMGTIYNSGGAGSSTPNSVHAVNDILDLVGRRYVRYRAWVCGTDASTRFCDASEWGVEEYRIGPVHY